MYFCTDCSLLYFGDRARAVSERLITEQQFEPCSPMCWVFWSFRIRLSLQGLCARARNGRFVQGSSPCLSRHIPEIQQRWDSFGGIRKTGREDILDDTWDSEMTFGEGRDEALCVVCVVCVGVVTIPLWMFESDGGPFNARDLLVTTGLQAQDSEKVKE